MAWTQRSSRKRSWLTSSAAPEKRCSQPSSHIAASRSRWLVGSSSSSRSGSRNSARASATRIRQPPENSPTGRACAAASKPRPASTVAARAGALSAPMARRRSWISPRRARVRGPAALDLGQQRGALRVRLQHRVEQAERAARRFLRHMAEAGAGGQADLAAIRRTIARRRPAAGWTCRRRCAPPARRAGPGPRRGRRRPAGRGRRCGW